MSKIFLNRNRQSLGQFGEEVVVQGLKSGRFLPTDLGWREGMETWKPLSEFDDLKVPEEEPFLPADELPPPPPLDTPLAPAWERREEMGTYAALSETIKEVIFRPGDTFRNMKPEGDMWKPLWFLMILGIPSLIIGLIWLTLFQLPAFSSGGANESILAAYPPKRLIFWIQIGEMIFSPILLPLSALIRAGIIHLCLMLTGGANKPFEATFRMYCYAAGALSIVQVVPVLGIYVYGIWLLIVICIGLKEIHDTDYGRTIIAVFLPLVVCCVFFIFIFSIPVMTKAMHLPH